MNECDSKYMHIMYRRVDSLRSGKKIPKCSTFHDLKTAKLYFGDYRDMSKKSTVRKNDRKYKKGDILCLRERSYSKYTGNEILAIVTHVLKDFPGIAKGYCVLSFEIIDEYGPMCKKTAKKKPKKRKG